MDHLPQPVVSSLILILHKFRAFAYYVVEHFVSIITSSITALSLRLVYSCFEIISRNWRFLFVPPSKEIQFFSWSFTFLAMSQFSRCDFAYLSLEISIQLFFFPFCFLVIFVLLMFVLFVLFLVADISLPVHFLCNLLAIVSMHRRNYYYYFTPLRVFHTSISWWSSTGIWVTVSLL